VVNKISHTLARGLRQIHSIITVSCPHEAKYKTTVLNISVFTYLCSSCGHRRWRKKNSLNLTFIILCRIQFQLLPTDSYCFLLWNTTLVTTRLVYFVYRLILNKHDVSETKSDSILKPNASYPFIRGKTQINFQKHRFP
jgi:hypothetical protein